MKIKFIETGKKFMDEKILIVDEVKQLLNLKREKSPKHMKKNTMKFYFMLLFLLIL